MAKKNGDLLDYGRLIDEAMHIIVRKALNIVIEHGLPGDHHFFITFFTRYEGVMISEELLTKYPEEMTIVIQHQFWDLEVEEDRFSVVLSFNGVKESLTVPLASISSFVDPSVKFGLQFRHTEEDLARLRTNTVADENEGTKSGKKRSKSKSKKKEEGEEGDNNVVDLDSFRKK